MTGFSGGAYLKYTVFTPGRTELAGNHTDHQNGRVLAQSVHLGHSAVFEANNSGLIRINSIGFAPIELRAGRSSPIPGEYGSGRALVRGMVSVFKDLGLSVGGFDAEVTSNLPTGSGLSSSAAFAVLIGKILNVLFNGGEIEPIVLARAAREAENEFFGKPCGLMSQLVCAMGGCVYADFSTNEITPVNAGFASMGLTLCLTDTGGSHAGLDSSYARIPADMRYIANYFDKGVLADVDAKRFYDMKWSKDDRPVRRAMHFFAENERVPKMRDALIAGNGEEYMRLMNESGRSSEELLNNIITSATGDTKLAEGIDLSAKLLKGKGAWRVHGGGFAGCVQALMPDDYFEEYKTEMEKKFGIETCVKIKSI